MGLLQETCDAIHSRSKEIEHVKVILSQDDEGQELESYLERSREIRGKLPYLTGQIKDN